jgi:HlyD family secretion protein
MNAPTKARRTVMVKSISAAAIVAVAGLAYFAAAGAGADDKTAQAPKSQSKGPQTSDIAVVQKMSFDISTTATGELKAKKQTEIRSELETESAIIEIVAEGTVVKKGDLLIKLNGDPIQTQIDEEELRVESAKADLVAAENGYEIQKSENDSKERQAKLKRDLAQLALDQWEKGEHVQKLQDIKLALDESGKELDRLREKYEKSQLLEKEGFLSKDQLQMDEIAHRKAQAAREKALLEEQTYNTYQEKKDRKSKLSDLEEAQAELDRTNKQNEIQLASKDADRLNKRRQLQLRTDKMAKLQKQLAACTMNAPQDGLVVYSTSSDGDFMMFNGQGPLQVGRKVFPNEPLIILPDTTEMMAQVKVHESLAGRVRPGLLATVKVDAAGGQTFTGKVDSIGVLAEGGGWRDPNRREYTVKIAIDHDSESNPLKPSMRCESTITLGHVEDSLAVPIQAVFNDEMVRFVYAPAAGRASRYVRIPVNMGQKSDTYAQITAGLDEGSRVLVRQPSPAEIVQAPWNEAQLKLAGFKLEDGKAVPIAGGRTNAPGRALRTTVGGNGPRPAPGAPKPEGAVVVPATETAPATEETKVQATAPATAPAGEVKK